MFVDMLTNQVADKCTQFHQHFTHIFAPIFFCQIITKPNCDRRNFLNRGTVASVVIQAIGSGTNEETLV